MSRTGKGDMVPFADDAASSAIGSLTVENGTERVALYGSLDLTRDRQGLEHARALKALVDAVVTALEGQGSLPDAVPPPKAPRSVPNPFG